MNVIRNPHALHYWAEQQAIAERRKQAEVDSVIDLAFTEHEMRVAMAALDRGLGEAGT
jgi:hypothetical protein